MSTDGQKRHLEQASYEHREAFEDELEELIARVKKIATGSLVLGGGFALSYYLVSKLGKGKKIKHKKNKSKSGGHEVIIEKKPSVMANVGHLILTEATIFLLAIIKEKVIEYIKNINSEEDGHSQNP